MQIEVIKQIDGENRETYRFNMFDTIAVLVRYFKENKPKGKRTWKIVAFWDTYNTIESKIEEPELSESIRNEALNELFKLCQVKTWAEWKSK